MGKIMDGKLLADTIAENLKVRVNRLKKEGKYPAFWIITTMKDDASRVYINQKIKRLDELGIVAVIKDDFKNGSSLGYEDLLEVKNACEISMWEYNNSTPIPVIIQKPYDAEDGLTDWGIDRWFWEYRNTIADVDGFAMYNIGRLAMGGQVKNFACTPRGIMQLLDAYNIDVTGKKVLIIGRSLTVGRPLAYIMTNHDATVTLAHSKTNFDDLLGDIEVADIIVSATGNRELLMGVPASYVTGKVLIDVGMNRDEDGKLCGDMPKEWYQASHAYTPVPGGVGPMTVIALMENIIENYDKLYSYNQRLKSPVRLGNYDR